MVRKDSCHGASVSTLLGDRSSDLDLDKGMRGALVFLPVRRVMAEYASGGELLRG
ncbi:MAG TPA: hypothetical protein VE134_10180 [Methanomicrobiales archaeon]|nr:hypothetical protein [Methanomicrobiales archaeon]